MFRESLGGALTKNSKRGFSCKLFGVSARLDLEGALSVHKLEMMLLKVLTRNQPQRCLACLVINTMMRSEIKGNFCKGS